MDEMKNEITDEKRYESEIQEIVDNLTLFDDDLMSRVFDQNIKATELFLGIVLNKKIKVVSVIGQDEMKNHEVGGRNITLDVHAIDENGQNIDIEVQGNAKGAHVRRARYHSGMMDSRMLKESQDFRELKDSYVIFMYKHDKFEKGLPIYHIDRYVRETNELFEDGSHIIYVNGRYKGDDSIGQLIEDFHQKDSQKMHYKELAEGVKHYKETEEGREIMCESVERYGDRRAEEAAKIAAEAATERATIKANLKSVKSLMDNMAFSLEQALNALGIQGNDRILITKQLQK